MKINPKYKCPFYVGDGNMFTLFISYTKRFFNINIFIKNTKYFNNIWVTLKLETQPSRSSTTTISSKLSVLLVCFVTIVLNILIIASTVKALEWL